MSYLVQQTRVASLLIGGQDYTSSLIEFQVSDASAFNRGLVTTSGTLKLGQRPGAADIKDYDRNTFKRGVVVTLDITEPGGSAYRHPRGYLYVLSVSYEAENEQLSVEVGCRLSLAFLTDDADAILPLVPIPLDPAQQTVENCSASFASAGMILYQDNQGDLISRKFWGTDSSAGTEAGLWVSALGETALSVSPLAGAGAIPDEIELSYQVPEGVLASDNSGKIDTVVETSQYFLNYPATVWKRNPDPTPSGETAIPTTVSLSLGTPGSTGSCGQVLSSPTTGSATINPGGVENYYLCADEWTTDRSNEYLPATRVSTSTTTYAGPAAQTSLQEQIVTGPEIEANPGYFADKYAYCVATYANACNPSGSCPYYGLDTYTLSKQLTTYEYGEANELIRTVTDRYDTILSAYTPEEWRSGINNGIPQGFNGSLSASSGLYRSQRVIEEYSQGDNSNIQFTTTFNSITSRGVGVGSGASIDALDGIKTTVKRESTTTTTLDIRPDTVNTATTSTTEQSVTILLNTDSYTSPPPEAGKYILEEAIPLPLLSTDENEISGWVADYSEYIKRFVKGDIYGLQIGESMRSEIVTNWYPGMPFRYADTPNNRVMAMRMDACAWGVTQDEAAVVTNGIFNGFSTGTIDIGSNLVGNSTPDLTGNSPTPPPTPSAPPSIINDVVIQNFAFIVDVNVSLSSEIFTYFEDGISAPLSTDPDDYIAVSEGAIVPYCTGFIVATGGLLAADGDGSIPVDYLGTLVTDGATVIDNNLFATA